MTGGAQGGGAQAEQEDGGSRGVEPGLGSGLDRRGGERSEGSMDKDSGLLLEAGGADGRGRRSRD